MATEAFHVTIMKKKLVVLTGAGKCREWYKTFRDTMVFGKDIMFKTSTPEGWNKNQLWFLIFIIKTKTTQRSPTQFGHQILAELEAHFDVFVITQNVDDLRTRRK
jgi:NAD-dependent deacetylase